MVAIMANTLRQDMPSGWTDDLQSSVEQDPTAGGSSGLEIGMAGMNFESSNISNNNTNTSRSPIPNSGDSVHSFLSVGTAASNQGDSFPAGASSGNNNRPPGLIAGLLVPPIGKPGHTKSASNSSTAHTATLTPTSSIDGGAPHDLYAVGGRQTHSPSASEHLPGIHNLGSFDTDDGTHDGLLGLQALRERAGSSTGPTISSTGGGNSSFSSSTREFVPACVQRGVIPSQQTRPRTITKDNSSRSVTRSSRPPLAGGSALSPHTVDGFGFSTPGSRSREASPPPNAGVISRPESQYSSSYGSGGGSESFDIPLRRALSNESLGTTDHSNSYGSHHREGSNDSHLNSSFSQPQLNIQQRVGGSGGNGPSLHGQGLFQSHHSTQSQPGPPRSLAGPDYYHEANYEAGFIPHRANIPPSNAEADYNMQQHQQQQQHDMRQSSHGGGQSQYQPGPRHGRSMSMQHSPYTDEGQDMGYGVQRRGSLGGHHDGQIQQPRDFVGGAGGGGGRLYNERERVGNPNYHRQAERYGSPANSTMHSSYGSSHSRHPSDMSSMSAHGSAPSLYGRHRLSDEDLSRPLAGENIEVPGEDHYYNEGALPIYQRSQSMGHVGHGSTYNSDSHHLPTVGASIQTPKIVYNVKFKRTQRTFEIGPRLNRDLPVGTYVKVEADRGEDLGIVIGRAKNAIIRSNSFGGGMGEMPPTAGAGAGGDMKKIIRLATHDEVSLLIIKREQEEELLNVCRTKVRQRGMPMHVVDAEYQFDRHKLTFFFEADTRIDFRELVRDLFSIYKTRIWMQQLDKSTTATCPLAPAPAPLVMDFGTPIIAPMSEYEGFSQAPGADDGTGTE